MQEYNNLIDAFSELHIEDKRHEIMHEMKELITVFQSLNMNKGKQPSLLLHHAMNDYKSENNENEFLNSIYSYIISTKELVGEYFEE